MRKTTLFLLLFVPTMVFVSMYVWHTYKMGQQRLSYEKYILTLQVGGLQIIQNKPIAEAKKELASLASRRLKILQNGRCFSIEGIIFPEDLYPKISTTLSQLTEQGAARDADKLRP